MLMRTCLLVQEGQVKPLQQESWAKSIENLKRELTRVSPLVKNTENFRLDIGFKGKIL
jgi:hypothetical protein